MREGPQYLLILACSQRKQTDADPLPAIECYTGVNFQVLHKARHKKLVKSRMVWLKIIVMDKTRLKESILSVLQEQGFKINSR